MKAVEGKEKTGLRATTIKDICVCVCVRRRYVFSTRTCVPGYVPCIKTHGIFREPPEISASDGRDRESPTQFRAGRHIDSRYVRAVY